MPLLSYSGSAHWKAVPLTTAIDTCQTFPNCIVSLRPLRLKLNWKCSSLRIPTSLTLLVEIDGVLEAPSRLELAYSNTSLPKIHTPVPYPQQHTLMVVYCTHPLPCLQYKHSTLSTEHIFLLPTLYSLLLAHTSYIFITLLLAYNENFSISTKNAPSLTPQHKTFSLIEAFSLP